LPAVCGGWGVGGGLEADRLPVWSAVAGRFAGERVGWGVSAVLAATSVPYLCRGVTAV
jgi:hypothetical protein